MEENNQDKRKVFISYAHNEEKKEWIIKLGKDLIDKGIDVILDVWDLALGDDLQLFMEKSIVDPDVTHILIICDEKYVSKANGRDGGVGKETTIISQSLFEKSEKIFIPVSLYTDANGNALRPTYLKHLVYTDFSDLTTYDVSFQNLIREIWNEKEYKKPILGDKPNFDKVIINNIDYKAQFSINLDKFVREAILLKTNYVDYQANKYKLIDEKIEGSEALKRLILNSLIYNLNNNIIEVAHIIDLFENLVKESLILDMSNGTGTNSQNDAFNFFLYELFLSVVTILIKNQKYDWINTILTTSYYSGGTGDTKKFVSFIEFRKPNNTLYYKNDTLKLGRLSISADYIKNRVDPKLFTENELFETDALLTILSEYHMAKNSNLPGWNKWWFPETIGYFRFRKIELFEKLKSLRHFEKLKFIFGETDLQTLKENLKKADDLAKKNNHRRGYTFEEAPYISDMINIEDIGTIA